MKKLILLIALVCSVMCAKAQTGVTWSAELGLGASGWMGNGAGNSNALFNPRVGVKLDIPLSGLLSFQTGLYWVSKGASYKDEVFTESTDGYHKESSKQKVNQNYFQMPLLAAFHLGTASNFDLVLTVGPYIAYGVSGKTSIEIGDAELTWDTFDDVRMPNELQGLLPSSGDGYDTMEGLHRFDAGILAGIGFDFPEWTVGLNAEFGLTRIQSHAPRNIGFFASAAYKF
ncbi:porin family protein [uncultured Bacteroides sp.]|uniref:porin family protein n=1 Tax=uncultured Bacteroides sp. TaxID=162156 RepID=UPI00260B3C3F|nr:porin family protein [uncultured Bacteroides sp.]